MGFYFKEQHFLRKIDQKLGSMLFYDNGNDLGTVTVRSVAFLQQEKRGLMFF